MKILMVCLGNICRSPLAEGILQHKADKLGLDWQVGSAGTAGYHVGEAPHRLSQKVSKMNGIDISQQQCRQFVKEDMLRFDRIYVMDSSNYNDVRKVAADLWDEDKVDLLLNELYPGKNKNVPDPWYGEEDGYHKVFDMIDKACDVIIEKYSVLDLKINQLVDASISVTIRSIMAKPSIPQGTRDFGADVVRKRNYIFNTIRNVFELYGFQPLETPAMENLDTLMGKYGEEGDKLIFKILNNGLADKSEKARAEFEKVLEGRNNPAITERALRYDLTIPFARYVAMNHGQLTMPFKRYQVQPVWRADRPQRGRYREFYQCDADVVGSKSLLNEVELTNIYATVFSRLGIEVEIRINSRKILAALAELCGGADKMMDITIAIDKLDKIGLEKVKEELTQRGLQEAQINTIERYLCIEGNNEEKIVLLKELVGENETGKNGIEEIEFILNYQTTSSQQLVADFTLARGLNYYTGTIFEIKAKNVQMGSIGGGGRYDDLTGTFGVPNIPGVGVSFGVDRIYDVMEDLQLFPQNVEVGTQVLFFNLGDAESKTAFGLMQQLRASNVRCELFHENAKFDKQFKYADKKGIAYAVIIGTKEMEEGTCMLKNLKSGEQQSLKQEQLINQSF